MSDMTTVLDRDGFCVPPFTLDESECDAVADRIGNSDGAGSRALLAEPWCRRLAERTRIGLAESLADLNGMVPVQCTVFRKSDRNNWLVPWHQDRSLPFDERTDARDGVAIREKDGIPYFQPTKNELESVIAIRLHLDPSHAGNGPLRLLAGSHVQGLLDPERIENLRNTTEESVPEIRRGGVLALRPLVLHASSKSVSNDPRRVLHFVYRQRSFDS